MKNIIPLLSCAAITSSVNAQILITGTSNNVPISEITYERNGTTYTQNSSSSGNETTADQILLQSVTINDGGSKTLSFANLGGTVSNLNLLSSVTGIGVSKGATTTSIEVDGLSDFTTAVEGTLADTDLNNYIYYDSLNTAPVDGLPDFDITFANPFLADDYIIVTERNGNTYFEITPLDINGNLIAGAKSLTFDSSTGGPGGYDWNTGFSSAYLSSQPQWMTVASASLFDTTDAVYGFRIDNDGEADVKFFGISDTPFVPEPSSTLLLGIGGLGLLARRKR